MGEIKRYLFEQMRDLGLVEMMELHQLGLISIAPSALDWFIRTIVRTNPVWRASHDQDIHL